jgi:1-acyl-sn-glycerol-3-phosphate acyltransferase
MLKFFQWIYTAYAALLFFVLMLLVSLFVLIPLLIHPRGDIISFVFIRFWVGAWSFLTGVRFKVQGREHIDLKQSYIYIFNHRSNLDAPLIPMVVPHRVRAIGKKELSKIPIFATVVGKLAVWVDRSNPLSRHKGLEKLISLLKKGTSVVVAPEGTRNNTDQTLLPFQKGAFRLAIETQTPILMMAVIGADHLMKRGSWLLKPGIIKVYYSKPILPPAILSKEEVDEFTEKCRNRLEEMILTHE